MEKIVVLVVEDELIVATNIQHRLQKLGYHVPCIVSTGRDAVQKAGEVRLDLILMDIRLGGEMDGIDAAEQIRSLYNIPIVYLTAYADSETLRRAKVTEPYGYIIKPVEDRELQSNIEIAVYKHCMELQLQEYRLQLNHLIGNGSNMILSFDRQHRIFLWNRAMERVTGLRQKEALKKTLEDCGVFCEPWVVAQGIDGLFAGKKPVLTEISLCDSNGSQVVFGIRHFFLTHSSVGEECVVLLGDDVTAESERKKQLVNGVGYVTFEKPGVSSQNPFFMLVQADYKGLFVTRANSVQQLSSLPLEGVKVVLLRESGRGLDHATTLEELYTVIESFLRQQKKSVVLLTRIDYLVSRFTFESFLLFLYKVNELVAAHQALFIVQADSVFFTEKQLALLSHELHLLPQPSVASLQIDESLIAILSYIYEQNQDNLLVSFKRIRSMFSIAYSTTAVKLKALESMGLVVVKKCGRSKAVFVSEKGKALLLNKK